MIFSKYLFFKKIFNFLQIYFFKHLISFHNIFTRRSSVRAQIGLQILSAALLYCCCHEDKGWVSFDQTLWLLDAGTGQHGHGRPVADVFRQKCALFLELVSQVRRVRRDL